MKSLGFLKAVPLLSSLLSGRALAQTFAYFTEEDTGVTVWQATIPTSQTSGGFQWGYALPPTAGDDDEYIGHLVGALQDGGAGWAGISHGGGMPSSLLLLAWVDGDEIKTSFRYASGYVEPAIYTGNATLTQLAHSINDTHFTLTYRCEWCWYWDQDGSTGSQPPTSQVEVIGWVQSLESPSDPSDPDSTIVQHDNGMGEFGANVASARASATSYSAWASAATAAPTTTKATTTTAATCTGTAVPTASYDYIVVGAGAGGIPIADKLSEAGKSVLLIEKGPPSSGRWGGTMRPESGWLDSTNLTRFDVPGLCNEIWVDSAGIACSDIDQMAGCVLGGGTAVNAGLWWKPYSADFDYNFPQGWKSSDMSAAISRVFSRIPGTDHPSMDGKLYYQQGYDVLANALSAGGYKNLTSGANASPDLKNYTYSHTPYMFSHGERGGPMATYLVSASARNNFKLLMNSSVRRVVRTQGHITGVELEGDSCGVVNVTANTGRVILSAGTFGSTKVLYRSGIGPTDQLQVVNASSKDGATMVKSADWISLPVGQNLQDHTNTDLVITHPNVTFYDFYAAWDDPITSDKNAYLNNRYGILAQAAPNIGPMIWQQVSGSDGVTRQLQYTARVEGPDDNSTHYMTISQYLGRGSTSRGALAINPDLTIKVATAPYLQTAPDRAAVITGITNLMTALSKDSKIAWVNPAPGQSVTDYVDSLPLTPAKRRANHWIGTAKMGTDNGQYSGGTAVVDTNTRVYGTDNLYVVDASVFPGMMTTNPSALIVSVAEQAAAKILQQALNSPVSKYGQCGGRAYTGARFCAAGLTCTYSNADYSQCL